MVYTLYKFPKVHGNRVVNHQRNGLRVLLPNWIPRIEAIENVVATDGGRLHNAKLLGVLNKLRDVCFLTAASLFSLAILDIIASLSLIP